MPTRCLLIPTAPGLNPTRRLDAAGRLGKTLHAHLNVLFISPDPARFVATLPEVAIAAGVSRDSIAEEISGAARLGRTGLETWCQANGVIFSDGLERLDATFASWHEVVGDLETEVALAGRVNDLVIIDMPDLWEPVTGRIFDAAVFSAGRPALIVPEMVPDDPLAHVAIAWNGSLEAARAVGQSISLLHEAQRVTIIEVETSRSQATQSADLAAYLRYHGIVAYHRRIEGGGNQSVAERILLSANRLEASMLMMGAYTHSRLREFFLGGVTQYVLDRAQIPILMSH